MAVPKQKHTKSRRDKRRAHIFLKVPTLIPCPKCGRLIPPHTVCPYCGYYKGVEVINVLKKLEKKERKKREKEIKEREKEQKAKAKTAGPLTMEELSRKKF
ncbi:50S ribosomal protein L32 [bacterium]|nr:50S ribosomal protein L32 [bacterium]